MTDELFTILLRSFQNVLYLVPREINIAILSKWQTLSEWKNLNAPREIPDDFNTRKVMEEGLEHPLHS